MDAAPPDRPVQPIPQFPSIAGLISREALRRRAVVLTLAFLLVIALGLRLYGINWDSGSDFSLHPDERSIVWTAQQLSPDSLNEPGELFDVDRSSLTPRRPTQSEGHGVYDYGSFPFYLLESTAWFVGLLPGVDKTNLYDMTLVGRGISAVLDAGTVLVVFLIGRRLFSPKVGLLAAAFATFAVIHIQLSHFYTTDVMFTFFGVLSFLFLAKLAFEGRKRDAVLAGIFFGLAIATKFSMAAFLPAVIVAPALYAVRSEDGKVSSWAFDRERLRKAVRLLMLTMAVIAIIFVVAQPYAILDFDHYAADSYNQSQMVQRDVDFPYTRQYDNSLPFLYHIWQFATWGVGLPMGVLMWTSLAATVVLAIKRRRKADLLLMTWVLPFFLITGLAEVKFLRYLLPITPFLAIMASRFALGGLNWLRINRSRWTSLLLGGRPYRAGVVALALVLFTTVFYAFAFVNVYSTTHPAVQVAEYVRANLPTNTNMAREHWDESLPGLYSYSNLELQLYDPDHGLVSYRDRSGQTITGTKIEHLADRLASSDYLVLFSNRLYSTIPTLPDRYPISTRYYQLLFDGDLGYDVEFVGQAYPNFLGVSFVNNTFSRPGLDPPAELESIKPTPITLNLGYADDSYVNYEHPMTILFKNVGRLGEEELRGILEGESQARSRGGILASPLPDEHNQPEGAVLSEEDARRQQEGGTFSDIFDRNSLSNRFPLLSWLAVVEIIALVSLPAGLILFRGLSDRGYLLIKALGILVVAYLTWLLASLHWLTFSVGTLWLSILAVALISALAILKAQNEIVQFLRDRWRLILFSEALFIVAFLSFYAIRAWNPDLWHPFFGGEKPMDFAYLNAVVKSTYMPAYDPWFAGGFLNYYYFGQFIIASLIKLTGIVPSVAYNLAVPLIFALTIGGAFSVVYNLAAARVEKGEDEQSKSRAKWQSPVVAGLAGSLFVAIIGNMDGIVQVVQGVWRVAVRDLPFWSKAEGYHFWRSSRMIDTSSPDAPDICGGCEITEFPFFSFLYADLHAHMIALPFAILAIGVGLSLVLRRPEASNRLLQWVGLGVLAFVVGALFTINSWDYPTYLILALVIVLLVEYLQHRRFSLKMVANGLFKAGLLVAVSLLVMAPFHLNYNGPIDFPFVQRNDFRTPLYQYLGIHGIFIFVVLSFLLLQLHRKYRIFSWDSLRSITLATRGAGRLMYLRDRSTPRSLYLIFSAALLIALASVGLHTMSFLMLIILLAAPLALRQLKRGSDNDRVDLFAFALLGMALALGIGTEVLKANIVDPGRMNTVFKLYFHAWVLFALASAYLLWRLRFGAALVGGARWKGLWMVGLAVMIISGLIYPGAATPARQQLRFNSLSPTTEGMAYMEQAVYFDDQDRNGLISTEERLELKWDQQAILWIQDNVEGSPVILEGNTPLYKWGNRISVYTGLPAIIGWDWHQRQQRWDFQDQVFERRRDVETLFTTTSVAEAQRLLEQYRVRYVYVGQLERLYYPQQGLAKFEEMVDMGLLEEVYPTGSAPNPEVLIYRIVD